MTRIFKADIYSLSCIPEMFTSIKDSIIVIAFYCNVILLDGKELQFLSFFFNSTFTSLHHIATPVQSNHVGASFEV